MADNIDLEGLADDLDGVRTGFRSAQQAAENLARRQQDLASKAFEKLDNATKGLASTMTSSMSKIASGSEDINVLTDAVAGFAKHIPLIGSAVSAAVKAMGQQAQLGVNAFYKISAAGLTTSEGIKGIALQLDDVKLPIDKWSELLAKSSKDLAYLGGTAMKGGQQFTATMTAMRSGLDEQLLNLGIRAEEIGELIVNQQTLEQRLGYQRLTDAMKQSEAVVDYVKGLKVLSKLTGESVSALAKQKRAVLDEAQFRAWAVMERKKGRGGQEATDRITNAMVILEKLEGGKFFKEISKGMVSGFATGDTAIKSMSTIGPMILDAMRELKAGRIDEFGYANAMRDIAKQFPDALNQLYAMGKQSDKMISGEGFVDIQNFAQGAKITAESLKSIQEETEKGARGTGKDGQITTDLMAAIKSMNSASGNMQRVLIANGTIAKSVERMAAGMETVTGWMAKAADLVDDAMGDSSNLFQLATKTFDDAVDYFNSVVNRIGNFFGFGVTIEDTKSGSLMTQKGASERNVAELTEELKDRDLDQAERRRLEAQLSEQKAEVARVKTEMENRRVNRERDRQQVQIDALSTALEQYRKGGLDVMNPSFVAGQQAKLDALTASIAELKSPAAETTARVVAQKMAEDKQATGNPASATATAETIAKQKSDKLDEELKALHRAAERQNQGLDRLLQATVNQTKELSAMKRDARSVN